MNAKVIAFEHYFQDGSKLCKWAMDKFSLGEEVVMMKMDDPTRGWLQVDSGKNQMETHNLLSALLLDRGAHMLEAIGKLKPNQVSHYLLKSYFDNFIFLFFFFRLCCLKCPQAMCST